MALIIGIKPIIQLIVLITGSTILGNIITDLIINKTI